MQSTEDIFRQYGKMVYKFVLAKTGNEDIAEEITQETFYQAIRCIDKYDGSCKVSTWLCAIAKNQLEVYFRKNKSYESLDNVQLVKSSAEDSYIEEQNKLELMKELHSISEPYREIMYLRIFGGLSFKEIGDIMEKTEGWARVNYYRGKEKLRKGMNDYGK